MTEASAANCLLSEEELLCSICLEVLTDPVSTPCGHNYCKECITENWRVNTPCRCPSCNEVFTIRPQLKTNTFIAAMVAQFRQRSQQNVLQDHCVQHHKPLELFCESDQSCVCVLCSLQHQGHTLVPLRDASQNKLRELQKSQAHTQRLILDRTQKIKEIRQSLRLIERAAEEEAAEGVEFFTALTEMVQKALDDVLQEIEDKQTKAKTQAEALIQGLEQEISELKQRNTELEQLRSSEDHLRVLKTIPSLTAAPQKDWTNAVIRTPSFLGTVVKTASELKKVITKDMEVLLAEVELQKVQRSAVSVTLDPDTAHPELSLSKDLKEVTHTGTAKLLPPSPKRITGFCGVLGKESFSCGRSYFEIQVKENYEWVVGVAKESISRSESVGAKPPNGFWAIWLYRGNEYGTYDENYVPLPLRDLQKVGVFLDYEEGLVSFYDISSKKLIYSFRGFSFTGKLFPYFYTKSKNQKKSVLCISPIRA